MSETAHGQGIGKALLERMIADSEREGYWTLQAQIMTGNHASRMLHEKCSFREVGFRERYGHLNGVWHDVILLERRSARTGGPGLLTRTCE